MLADTGVRTHHNAHKVATRMVSDYGFTFSYNSR
jgi:hypothetical protein